MNEGSHANFLNLYIDNNIALYQQLFITNHWPTRENLQSNDADRYYYGQNKQQVGQHANKAYLFHCLSH